MSGLIDFVAGAGAVGAQLGTDAIRSQIEEEKAARLAETANKYQVARDTAQHAFVAGESEKDRGFRSGESEKDRTWRTGEAATDRTFRAGESEKERGWRTGERQGAETFTAGENDKNRKIQEKQLAIAGGHLALAREQAMKGTQVIGDDGRVAFVTTTRGKDGKPVANTTFLKNEDGTDFIAPKNINERQKLEFNALSERIKALDKVAADSMNEKGAERARAEILVLSDQQRAILSGKPAAKPGGEVSAAVKDPFAAKGPDKGDAKFEDMKRQGEKAGPMSGPAPAARSGADPAADLLKTGEALEARNPELKALGNQMRLMDGNAAASARAAYLQKVRDIQSGATARRPIIPDLIR